MRKDEWKRCGCWLSNLAFWSFHCVLLSSRVVNPEVSASREPRRRIRKRRILELSSLAGGKTWGIVCNTHLFLSHIP
jgi:hypothetical protein